MNLLRCYLHSCPVHLNALNGLDFLKGTTMVMISALWVGLHFLNSGDPMLWELTGLCDRRAASQELQETVRPWLAMQQQLDSRAAETTEARCLGTLGGAELAGGWGELVYQ